MDDGVPLQCGGAGVATPVSGCMDPLAVNYNPAANRDDASCRIPGCTNTMAGNYSPTANVSTQAVPVTTLISRHVSDRLRVAGGRWILHHCPPLWQRVVDSRAVDPSHVLPGWRLQQRPADSVHRALCGTLDAVLDGVLRDAAAGVGGVQHHVRGAILPAARREALQPQPRIGCGQRGLQLRPWRLHELCHTSGVLCRSSREYMYGGLGHPQMNLKFALPARPQDVSETGRGPP